MQTKNLPWKNIFKDNIDKVTNKIAGIAQNIAVNLGKEPIVLTNFEAQTSSKIAQDVARLLKNYKVDCLSTEDARAALTCFKIWLEDAEDDRVLTIHDKSTESIVSAVNAVLSGNQDSMEGQLKQSLSLQYEGLSHAYDMLQPLQIEVDATRSSRVEIYARICTIIQLYKLATDLLSIMISSYDLSKAERLALKESILEELSQFGYSQILNPLNDPPKWQSRRPR